VTESRQETDSRQGTSDLEAARAADVEAEQGLVPHVKQKSLLRWAIEISLSVGVAAAIFAVVLPRVTGSSYAEVWEVLGELQGWQVAMLSAAWLVNMVMYTGVLTASLPGLTHPKAFVANLSSSAVSNVLPFGGAVGVAATYLMYGSWGFGAGAITRSILVSGVWNVLVKLAMPAVAFVLLAATGQLRLVVVVVTVLALVAFAAACALLWLVLHSDTFAAAVGRASERVLGALARLVGKRPITGIESRVVAFRHDSRNLIVERWVPLSVWIALYNLTQFGVFLMCLEVLPDTGHDLGWAEAFAAFTVGRLLSNVSVTPSGVGFVEAGMAGLLVAAGGDPATVTAAVLLFSAFTYLAEIPVGAAGWLVWATRSSWRSPERRPRNEATV
jgi:uncharacterized membrane protein YbhN (UPF0104 family)